MEVSVNGIKLHYEVYGSGRPVILLGGNMKNTSYLSFMRKELGAYCKVYFIDRRGSGKSTSDCTLNYPETVKDISEFMEKDNESGIYQWKSAQGLEYISDDHESCRRRKRCRSRGVEI